MVQELVPQDRSFVDWLPDAVAPPRHSDVLIKSEKVYYYSSRHPMMLVRPLLEAVSAVQLGIWVLYDEPFGMAFLLNVWAIASVWVLAVWATREPRSSLIARLATVLFAALVTGTGLTGLVWFGMIAMLTRLAREAITWRWYRRLYVTDRRILETNGILDRSVATMPLGRVTDARVTTSLAGQWFDYGEFHLETAGQKQALGHLYFLRDAKAFNETVMGLATNPKTFEAGY